MRGLGQREWRVHQVFIGADGARAGEQKIADALTRQTKALRGANQRRGDKAIQRVAHVPVACINGDG